MKIYKNNYCKICFKKLNDGNSLSSLFSYQEILCKKCQNKFKDIDYHFKIYDVDIWILYEYNAFIRKLIYDFKGCYDIELADVFFHKYKNIIRKKYHNFVIVYPPSSDIENLHRGFIHMKEMVKSLKMKNEELFLKTIKYKQSDQLYKNRKNISKYIKLKDDIKIIDKKYLIVDDIYTSGSTIKTIIKILVDNGVSTNNIKCLILCKTSL